MSYIKYISDFTVEEGHYLIVKQNVITPGRVSVFDRIIMVTELNSSAPDAAGNVFNGRAICDKVERGFTSESVDVLGTLFFQSLLDEFSISLVMLHNSNGLFDIFRLLSDEIDNVAVKYALFIEKG